MSLFGKILDKLGFHHGAEQAASPQAQAPGVAPTPQAAPSPQPATAPVQQPTTPPTAISPVDVTAKLDAMAASHPEKLNWKVSIVDLLKLLGLDSSLAARKDLATELGCPPDLMGDSAQMNMWLHKTVLRKLAENGGNVPKELLD